ncbi:Lpg1974 family pore-forming outer membrane protein [Candidatus Neptunochlamydia vexilliferae]|nr:Lpg1974 family pore-forming outer membrane protein [Candidatus Neptunochlamydia vexilliferae]
MEMKLRKLWPLIGALCLSLVTPVFAQGNYGGSSSNSQSMHSTSPKAGQGIYQRGTFREITPNAGPRVAHGADVFIRANFIWWKAVQEGTPTVYSGISGTKGKSLDYADEWDPGFKVGLGLNLSHDGWDICSQYTWLHGSNTSSQSSSNLGFSQDSNASGQSASGNFDYSFNSIDLELGRNFYLSQFLTMRPFIGFKGTWQDQEHTTKLNTVVNNAVTSTFKARNDFDVWALGFRGGLNLAYYMAKSWSIYGNVAFSNLWANYTTIEAKGTTTPTGGDSTTNYHRDQDTHYAVKYVFESEIGLRWEMWFSDDNYHFAIQAGWAEQSWINWGVFDTNGALNFHDFNMHGLNLQFRFDF